MFLYPPTPHAISSIQPLHSHMCSSKPYTNNSLSTLAHTLPNLNSCLQVLLKCRAPSHVPTLRILLRYCTWTLLASSCTHVTHLLSTNHEATWVQTQVSTCIQTCPHYTDHSNHLDRKTNTNRNARM